MVIFCGVRLSGSAGFPVYFFNGVLFAFFSVYVMGSLVWRFLREERLSRVEVMSFVMVVVTVVFYALCWLFYYPIFEFFGDYNKVYSEIPEPRRSVGKFFLYLFLSIVRGDLPLNIIVLLGLALYDDYWRKFVDKSKFGLVLIVLLVLWAMPLYPVQHAMLGAFVSMIIVCYSLPRVRKEMERWRRGEENRFFDVICLTVMALFLVVFFSSHSGLVLIIPFIFPIYAVVMSGILVFLASSLGRIVADS